MGRIRTRTTIWIANENLELMKLLVTAEESAIKRIPELAVGQAPVS